MTSLNPMAASSIASQAPTEHNVPFETHLIGGILVDVYGLSSLPSDRACSVSCLWLLHPRLCTKETMSPFAIQAVITWQSRSEKNSNHHLIVIAFDQRNHGSRIKQALANEAWRQGNPRHAQDMFSTIVGTAADTTLLIDFLPSYLFANTPQKYSRQIIDHQVLGVSLGGHAAWQVLLHEPRVTSGVVVIGCADYRALMEHRAEKSKRESWMQDNGRLFLGSSDYPHSLDAVVRARDPAGLLMGGQVEQKSETSSYYETESLSTRMQTLLAGKRIFNQAGGNDKLVPYTCSEPFLNSLTTAVQSESKLLETGTELKNVVYEDAGHEMNDSMVKDALLWIVSRLAEAEDGGCRTRVSKI